MSTPRYTVTAAREAAEMGYGDRDYWDYLEESGLERSQWYADRGLQIQSHRMLTRSLSEALAGNEGD